MIDLQSMGALHADKTGSCIHIAGKNPHRHSLKGVHDEETYTTYSQVRADQPSSPCCV